MALHNILTKRPIQTASIYNSMEHSSSCEANGHLISQKILHLLWTN
jgi:hypothetical protein